MRAATIYKRGDKIYAHSSSKTTAGVWVINTPALAVSKENVSEIGRSIRTCLAASHEGVPHPRSFGNLFDPVLDLVGVKSFGTFVKTAKCVEVEMVDDAITLIPTRNEGVKEGFTPLPNKMQIAIGSDEALGSAVLATLAIAA